MSKCSGFRSVTVSSVRSTLDRASVSPGSTEAMFVLDAAGTSVRRLRSRTKRGCYPPKITTSGVTTEFNVMGRPVMIYGTYVDKSSTRLLTGELVRGRRFSGIVIYKVSYMSGFAVTKFLSFGTVSPCRYEPFSVRELKLGLKRTTTAVVFDHTGAGGSF